MLQSILLSELGDSLSDLAKLAQDSAMLLTIPVVTPFYLGDKEENNR